MSDEIIFNQFDSVDNMFGYVQPGGIEHSALSLENLQNKDISRARVLEITQNNDNPISRLLTQRPINHILTLEAINRVSFTENSSNIFETGLEPLPILEFINPKGSQPSLDSEYSDTAFGSVVTDSFGTKHIVLLSTTESKGGVNLWKTGALSPEKINSLPDNEREAALKIVRARIAVTAGILSSGGSENHTGGIFTENGAHIATILESVMGRQNDIHAPHADKDAVPKVLTLGSKASKPTFPMNISVIQLTPNLQKLPIRFSGVQNELSGPTIPVVTNKELELGAKAVAFQTLATASATRSNDDFARTEEGLEQLGEVMIT